MITVKDLIQQLIDLDSMNAIVSVTSAQSSLELDNSKPIDITLKTVFDDYKGNVYLTINLDDANAKCTENCPFKALN